MPLDISGHRGLSLALRAVADSEFNDLLQRRFPTGVGGWASGTVWGGRPGGGYVFSGYSMIFPTGFLIFRTHLHLRLCLLFLNFSSGLFSEDEGASCQVIHLPRFDCSPLFSSSSKILLQRSVF